MSKRAVELDAASAVHGQVTEALKKRKKTSKKSFSKPGAKNNDAKNNGAKNVESERVDKDETSSKRNSEDTPSDYADSKEQNKREEPIHVKSERLDTDETGYSGGTKETRGLNTPRKEIGHIAMSAPKKVTPKKASKTANTAGQWKQPTLPSLYNTRQFKNLND